MRNESSEFSGKIPIINKFTEEVKALSVNRVDFQSFDLEKNHQIHPCLGLTDCEHGSKF